MTMRVHACSRLVGLFLTPAVTGIVTLCGLLSILSAPSLAAAAEGAPFGIESFTMQTIERTEITEVEKIGRQGVEIVNKPYVFTQAGGHPWGLTTAGEFTSEAEEFNLHHLNPTRDPKDIVTHLPPGLLGNPQAVPRCPLTQATSSAIPCPADTQVGSFLIVESGQQQELGAIVNVTPSAGESAEFMLVTKGQGIFSALLTAHLVRIENPVTKEHEYGLTVDSNNIPRVGLLRFELTFWGVPADPSHNPMRGRYCTTRTVGEPLDCSNGPGGESAGITPVPFLSMPTSCSSGPEMATISVDTWQNPVRYEGDRIVEGEYVKAAAAIPAATGCNLLKFEPLIEALPDTLLADQPVGLGVNLTVPQPEQPGIDATPPLRNAVVTLPEGLSISPGIVDGIQACEESGAHGINFEGAESEEIGPSEEVQLAPGHCPDASIVGTAEAITPLLGEPVKGHVYLAKPLCGGAGEAPCAEQDALDGRLYQLYLELGGEGPLANTGINIKAHGYVEANPATGQLTTKFLQNPQTPFSELKIRLNGGPRAPLDNPAVCGPAVTTADFTPWSAPGLTPEGLLVAGTADGTSQSYYSVAGCASPPGLHPGFQAGTVSSQAGQFSAFTLDLSRQDREQFVKGIQVHTPAGLLGMLSSVPLCEEPLADSGHCPESSKIGTTAVASGAGSHPFEIGGNVYLTKSYGGAPFGLSIVTNVVVGPFNLGLVVVRARIEVDPETSELTITTDEAGPYRVPQILFGVPVRLKRITVNIDRPDFMFNPTSCAAKQISATVSGNQDATATVSSPFAAGGCKSLAFRPKFIVSASGKTSRAKGASLDAQVSYPAGSVGNEANIAYAKVSLPKQLPSRLTTLQKACPSATFRRNPAECPAGSVVGVVRARTQLLPVELAGPVYFVSHGGEQFPSLIVVLQGDGVRVDLTGTTFINKAGITSTTFKTVPDVPVGTFELFLPQGKNSALAANGNLCKLQSKLRMPTEFVAQNGAVLKQSTKIAVTGCGKAKPKPRQRKRGRASRMSGSGSKGRR